MGRRHQPADRACHRRGYPASRHRRRHRTVEPVRRPGLLPRAHQYPWRVRARTRAARPLLLADGGRQGLRRLGAVELAVPRCPAARRPGDPARPRGLDRGEAVAHRGPRRGCRSACRGDGGARRQLVGRLPPAARARVHRCLRAPALRWVDRGQLHGDFRGRGATLRRSTPRHGAPRRDDHVAAGDDAAGHAVRHREARRRHAGLGRPGHRARRGRVGRHHGCRGQLLDR